MPASAENVHENPSLHNRAGAFKDRDDAGQQLASLLKESTSNEDIVVAIPAGGVPVAATVARHLGLELKVLVVSKITLPWNPEAGFGAVAADGTREINQPLAQALRLDQKVIEEQTLKTIDKVRRRSQLFGQEIGADELAGRTVILVDDGLASGFTMKVAIKAARNLLADRIIVAVPTGHGSSVMDIAQQCDLLYCANIREGMRYAVADAYEQWSDVSEQEVLSILQNDRLRSTLTKP